MNARKKEKSKVRKMLKKYQPLLDLMESYVTCVGHHMDHIKRVYDLSMDIAATEDRVDYDVLVPAILLHDIAKDAESNDLTGTVDHALLGSEMAGEILTAMGYERWRIKAIQACIRTHRFRTDLKAKSIEAKILYDADKLDILGATGISRSFMLAGQYGQKLYEPFEGYSSETNTGEGGKIKDLSKHSPYVEYQLKFKKIPEQLYTYRAKAIAARRLAFMETFFDRLRMENEMLRR